MPTFCVTARHIGSPRAEPRSPTYAHGGCGASSLRAAIVVWWRCLSPSGSLSRRHSVRDDLVARVAPHANLVALVPRYEYDVVGADGSHYSNVVRHDCN